MVIKIKLILKTLTLYTEQQYRDDCGFHTAMTITYLHQPQLLCI